jgi:hypothetical protein
MIGDLVYYETGVLVQIWVLWGSNRAQNPKTRAKFAKTGILPHFTPPNPPILNKSELNAR